MKKSNKKSQTNIKKKDKIEDMSRKEKNKWEKPKKRKDVYESGEKK